MILAAIKVSIWLVLVQGHPQVADTQLDQNAALYIWSRVADDLRAQGFDPRLRRFRVIKDPAPPSYSAFSMSQVRLSTFTNYAFGKRWLRRNRAIHFITPRTIEGYMVGWSSGVCSYRNSKTFLFQLAAGRMEHRGGAVSYSTGQFRNIKGAPRLEHSAEAARHEIGHDIGADHISTATLMNPDPLGLYESFQHDLKWDRESLRQIFQCLS